MDSVVQLILPPHVRGLKEGSDHIWTLLPSLEAHFRSQSKSVCGLVYKCVRACVCASGLSVVATDLRTLGTQLPQFTTTVFSLGIEHHFWKFLFTIFSLNQAILKGG